jgi:hypothetical protein
MVIAAKLRARRAIFAALLFIGSFPTMGDPWNGLTGTITAGTAIPLVPNRGTVNQVMVNSIFFQATDCSSTCGLIYILSCNPKVTCVKGNANTTYVCELAAGTASAPGGWCRLPTNGAATNSSGGTDLRYFAVDGATSGTPFLASWDVRQ